MTASVVRGAAECTAAAGNVIAQVAMQPVRSGKEAAKSCLGYYDFRRAATALTTSEVPVMAQGQVRTVRIPVPERISTSASYALTGVCKAVGSSVLGYRYATGTLLNLVSTSPIPSTSQIFAGVVNESLTTGLKLGYMGVKIVAQVALPIIRHFPQNPDLYMRTGATAACLYGASYGIVKASESQNILGKIGNSAIAAISLAGAYYTSGLNQLAGAIA